MEKFGEGDWVGRQAARANKINAHIRGRNYFVAATMNIMFSYLFEIQDKPYNFWEFIITLIDYLNNDNEQRANSVIDNFRFQRNEKLIAFIRAHGHFVSQQIKMKGNASES